MSDRDLHDHIIRALADAPYRTASESLADLVHEGGRVDRFATFLARHFYYERLHHLFKYARALARITDRRPEEVVRSSAFDALLPNLVLGSRDSAVQVGRLASAHVRSGRHLDDIPYLDDLLLYEEARMMVESGPRGHPSDDDVDVGPAVAQEGTTIIELAHDIVPLLPKLLTDWVEPPTAEREPIKLLIARTRAGRVTTVRATSSMERLLELADGSHAVDVLARDIGATGSTVEQALTGLKEIGAIRFSTGS